MRLFDITPDGTVTETTEDTLPPDLSTFAKSMNDDITTAQFTFKDGTHLRIEADDSGTPMQVNDGPVPTA